tara:strand:- start:8890 stop:9654 length:765 start_codon:yes stop_codon:yes gene_type:complete
MTEHEKHEKPKEHVKHVAKHLEHTKDIAKHAVHHDSDDETFTVKKTTLWQGISGVLVLLLAISIFTGGFGFGGDSGKDNNAVVEIGDSPVKGDDDAPVTIIEFSDFQCTFCSVFYSQTLPQIEEEYVNTGKVKFVYKHFPLDNIHPQATPAALASECAQEQGKFWEFHNTIFENQQSLSDASYKQWAVDLSLDTEKFNDCYDTQKYLSDVRDDLQKGSAAGIRGTPGFLLNGQLISGAKPFAVFEQAIEAELAG